MEATQERNSPENVKKLISLLYMHTQDIGFAEFNKENTCGIYNVDPSIMEILEDVNAIKRVQKNGKDKYSWGSVYPTNEFMGNIHKTLLNHNTNQKPKVMKRKNKKVTPEVKQAVVDTMHMSLKEAAPIVDRSTDIFLEYFVQFILAPLFLITSNLIHKGDNTHISQCASE